jgi:predicted nucleic acid-binding protein
MLLDTTILVYAMGGDHPLAAPCRVILRNARRLQATTTVECIQEFLHVRARRRSRADAAELAEAFVAALPPLVRPDHDDLLEGAAIFRGVPALGSFDAILAATARRSERRIVSADRAFSDVPGLRYVSPTDEAAIALLLRN